MRILTDRLLRVSVVVENDAGLWLCPRRPGGWQNKTRLTMTPQARSERLRPAKGIDAATLGIPEESEPQDCPKMNERPAG